MTTEHRAFFGDGERIFRLSPDGIMELERVAGAGIGALCRRMFGGDFAFGDLRAVVRLALIGGGAKPEDAEALCRSYLDARPFSETYPLAVAVLEALWFGRDSGGTPRDSEASPSPSPEEAAPPSPPPEEPA